ncbi:MAG: serine/threonine protein kinase, partial [Gemmatimonadetes bacterium]|nr:serine/threonine protein kinase [Gemmatimonadota bacterium]
MTDQPNYPTPRDAATTPAGITTICPQCGATLDALTTSCGRCGAVITGGGAGGEREERLRVRLQGQIGAAYQLGPMIGRGGMGIVFRAREVALDREVALKVLAFDPVLNPDAFERFEREARLAARLDHPNIVPIFAVGQGDGAAFYTMRFVRGGSLETTIADHGALALDTAVKLLQEIAAALDYAHAQGIVHRDIKPANILLSETGHAMVADFGIARAFTGDAVTSTSGSHTGVVGSPAYMAPEQWRGDKPDGRADQYALGVLAFEMLSGLRPFREVSMQELLRMHLNEEPPELRTLRKDLPSYIGDAIRRAMAKEPSDRFASTTAFVAALAGEGGTIAAAPARGAGRRPARRRLAEPVLPPGAHLAEHVTARAGDAPPAVESHD